MDRLIFDDTAGFKTNTQALNLSAELQKTVDSLKTSQNDAQGLLAQIGVIVKGNKIIADLMQLSASVSGGSLQVNDEPSIPLQYPRQETAKFYHFVESAGKATRQKQNDAAYAIVDQYLKAQLKQEDLTDEQRIILGKYSGNGGNLTDNLTGQEGSAFEYYTPMPIANGVWDALKEMGFNGGKVLDPCGGTGIFGASAPLNAAVDTVELDTTSGTVNKLINESDSFRVTISNFEKIAANTPDNIYDAVVTNVPFGDNREGNQFDDPKYQKEPLENYFILRSLDKLKPNGLAAFIVPPRCTDGKGGSPEKLRFEASLKAEFLGAYRLPNKVFGAASADTITDVIFFRKYSNTAAEKIAELRESSPETLSKANVLWDSYLNGKYFDTAEGMKHVLGEFIAKDPNKFRDVNRVVNAASIPDIAKLLRKLPKSRIDWALLEETETMPIVYNEGDTIAQDGTILQLKNGEWVVLTKPKASPKMTNFEAVFKTPLAAFNAQVEYDQLRDYSSHLTQTAQYSSFPMWVKAIQHTLERFDLSERPDAFKTFLVGLTVLNVMDTEGRDSGTNFLTMYPELSAAMKAHAALAKQYKIGKGMVKTGLANIGFHYSRKGGYSNFWKGEVTDLNSLTNVSDDASFEGLIYKNKSPWISLDDAKSVYGDSFDPYSSDDWCITSDGQTVIRADDYYVGNFAQFSEEIERELSEATDEKIIAKLLKQKMAAFSRIQKVEAEKMSFHIRSPYVTNEEKVQFLRTYIDPSADIEVDENGKEKIKFSFKGGEVQADYKKKLYRRLAVYFESGNATLGTADFEDISKPEAIKELRELIATTNEQFNGWVRSNKRIIDRLNMVANDPKKLQFISADDESPMVIQGMNPDLTLHGYQNSFVRKMSRSFEGINGFDVGLGKTFTGLAAVQYVQSIGVKKKTIFVVPNAVLSNWRKEALRAYTSIDDCLFVGLREVKGRFVSNSKYYDEDLHRVLENNHSKIFMTMEAFQRIKLKNESIEDFERYLRTVDQSFAESENRKKDSKAKDKVKTLVQILTGKEGSAPYLEDMGVDSIVIDEAHTYKNSSETVDFKGGKYLSVADSSAMGMDAQAKAWLIRGKAAKGDGVLLLTATPVTNSPLEVYSMLSLAVGHGRVNDMAVGTKGADEFMSAVCIMVNEEDEGIDGSIRDMQVFKGLDNTDMLRRSIEAVATIKDAEMVGKSIYVPEAVATPTDVTLPDEMIEELQKFKLAYRYAAALAKDKIPPDQGEEEYEEIKAQFGESDEILGHPFNLIRKMTNLIADPDLAKMMTCYNFAENDRAKVVDLVKSWNANKPKEDWNRLSPNIDPSDVKSAKEKVNKKTGVVSVEYKVVIRAWIDGNRVCIDSTYWKTQDKFEALMEKSGLDYDVPVPPKMAALLENFKKECATPRGLAVNENGEEVKLPYAKQIIFCDMLGMHNKIRRALAKHAGIAANQIMIITGQRNNQPADLLDIQNGFNAVEDNLYRVIIANEKAEVGINLQIGTQAIHHLTIGWTPDSLQQRNGRGARQGNLTDHVATYFYDAEGTFDVAKRALVDSKATWIGDLLSKDGGNKVEIIGGMSQQQIEALIDSVGDADAVNKVQERMLEIQNEMNIQQNKFKQVVNLNTILKENKFLSDNASVRNWLAKLMGELHGKVAKKTLYTSRANARDASLNAIAKNKDLAAGVQAEIDILVKYINDAVTIRRIDSSTGKPMHGSPVYDPIELVNNFNARAKRGENSAPYLIKAINTTTTYHFEFNEDSALKDDWQSEIDMSTSLRDNAVDAYEEQAGKDGAHRKGLGLEFKNGGGIIMGDTLVAKNSFIVLNGDVNQGFYAVGNEGIWGGNIYGLEDGSQAKSTLGALLERQGVVIAHPDSELHEQCLAAAAKYEDDIYASGKWEGMQYFSDRCSYVAARRSTDAVVEYSYDNFIQTLPYFPKVFKPSDVTSSTPVRAHIMEQHKKIIHRFDSYHYWVKNDIEVQNSWRVNRDGDALNELLRDYTIAHNLRANYSDLMGTSRTSFVFKYLNRAEAYSADKVAEIIEAATTEDGLDQAIAAYLNACLPWFDFATLDMRYVLSSKLSDAYYARVSAIRKANEPKPDPAVESVPVVEPETTIVAPTAEGNVDQSRIHKDLMVMVTGEGTMANKGRLKALAEQWKTESPNFEFPHWWKGKTSRWHGKVLSWEIPYGAWAMFKAQYPSELHNLSAEVSN